MKCKNCGNEFSGKFCPECGMSAEPEKTQSSQSMVIDTSVNSDNSYQTKPKKPFYKKWWFWVIAVIVVMGIIGNLGDSSDSSSHKDGTSTSRKENNNDSDTESKKKVEVTVVDFSKMNQADIQKWADTNKVTCTFEQDYSDTIAKGSFVSQSANANEVINEGDEIFITYSMGKEPSMEFKNALSKAETYSSMMHMSKQGIYDQLTSAYGEGFAADAAQYAIDNMVADWNANALEKAKTYSDTMNMSKQGIYDQLTSAYGEQFTAEEAQYAVNNVQADWNKNALEKAKTYQSTMSMSKQAIYDQLVSAYGEQFTAQEAQYAIDNLGN